MASEKITAIVEEIKCLSVCRGGSERVRVGILVAPTEVICDGS